MVTPIAKCSLKVKKAEETREARWMLCSRFLREEIGTMSEAGLLCPSFGIVTVGDQADGFLTKAPSMMEFTSSRLGKLTHYGAYRRGAFRIADTDRKVFTRFFEEHKPLYCAFVREHVPWDQHKIDHELRRDMEILFKWNRQMDPWRERLL
ncbi:MAG: hypothetical protein PHX83_16140 [Acidobacteriia bacterium]|nr:hypothetical protein [Terriglobia bacterium]